MVLLVSLVGKPNEPFIEGGAYAGSKRVQRVIALGGLCNIPFAAAVVVCEERADEQGLYAGLGKEGSSAVWGK